MELKIKAEDLRKKSIFLATPMYGGMNHGLYLKSVLDLQGLCMQYGVQIKFSFLFNESLIPRARNYLADEFVSRSDCTHMLFIDSDIAFNPQDVIACLALDKEIIGAPYPKKSIKWANVKKAVANNPEIDAGQLGLVTGDFVFNPVKGTSEFRITEPLEVMDLGTGFMMIDRNVFTKYREAYPEMEYKPDHVGQANFGGERNIFAYFHCDIDPESKRYLSEDYWFTQKCRTLGVKTWLCPWMRTEHIGTYHFKGDMVAIAQHIREL